MPGPPEPASVVGMTESRTETPGGLVASRRPITLVTYASKSGSTRGIAERIAHRLRDGGHAAELEPVDAVHDLSRFDAVVLGSAVFNGQWMPEADAFVAEQAGELRDRAVWLFSVGTFGDDRPVLGPVMRREPRGIGDLVRQVGAHDYRVFAGVIKRSDWPLASRIFYHALGGRLGDHRNWDQVEGWADQIAAARTRAAREK